MRHHSGLRSWVVGFALLGASTALAQDASRSSCEVPWFRGAGSAGGAVVDVKVVNNGRPCLITIYIDPYTRLETTEIRAQEAPQHGTLEFPAPNVAAYTPNPGYTGPDRYAFAGRGMKRTGYVAELLCTVRATVVNP